jgi:hypothetical protein
MIPATSHALYWMRHRSVHVPCAASNAQPILNPATSWILYQMAHQMQAPRRRSHAQGVHPAYVSGFQTHLVGPLCVAMTLASVFKSSIINHRVPLPGGRVARIVSEFCARTAPENGATPCAQRNKEFFGGEVSYLLNCCTNVATSDKHEKYRETCGALPTGTPNAINAVSPTDIRCVRQTTCATAAEPSRACRGERSFAPTVGVPPKPPRFSALGQWHDSEKMRHFTATRLFPIGAAPPATIRFAFPPVSP